MARFSSKNDKNTKKHEKVKKGERAIYPRFLGGTPIFGHFWVFLGGSGRGVRLARFGGVFFTVFLGVPTYFGAKRYTSVPLEKQGGPPRFLGVFSLFFAVFWIGRKGVCPRFCCFWPPRGRGCFWPKRGPGRGPKRALLGSFWGVPGGPF